MVKSILLKPSSLAAIQERETKVQQMAVLLSPNPGTIYVGTVTYTASIPIKIMILHELDDGDDGSTSPYWTINFFTKYAVTFLELGASGTANNGACTCTAFRTEFIYCNCKRGRMDSSTKWTWSSDCHWCRLQSAHHIRYYYRSCA